ncbi:Venom serine carboxypeptidase [Eumeta japonica]|uniref:Venom serine carboxypeptidase n=1 Tax=Eumeta variegata TaxID=151549 RepID=A0A4C1UD39_EUMVA|nr:Venom serine carboxypeptidase [Eumeta japonica]
MAFFHRYPIIDANLRKGDAGDPLILTPYIESGNITIAQELSRVPFTESLRIKSYAGFFTVNKTYESNQFFWYFPAMVPNKALAPVIVWLQGGPGASSLFGLFTENGPLRVRNDRFERRKYNWALNHHIIYIDNPVDWSYRFQPTSSFEDYEKRTVAYIQNKQWDKAFETFDALLNGDLIEKKSVFYNYTGFEFYFNYLHTKDPENSDFGHMLQKSSTRRAIHVGNLPFHNGSEVEEHLKSDVMQSVAPLVSELLNHYDVVVYNGQLDIIVAYPLTVNYLKNLNFTGAEKYKTAKRYIWKVDGEIAGYVKQADKLIEIMVRNAGHMVPADQPKWALDLITRFTHEKSLIK